MGSLGWGPDPVGLVSIWQVMPESSLSLFFPSAEQRPCEDAARRPQSSNSGRQPYRKLHQLEPWLWTSIFQNCKEIGLCCISHPVYSYCHSSLRRLIQGNYLIFLCLSSFVVKWRYHLLVLLWWTECNKFN